MYDLENALLVIAGSLDQSHAPPPPDFEFDHGFNSKSTIWENGRSAGLDFFAAGPISEVPSNPPAMILVSDDYGFDTLSSDEGEPDVTVVGPPREREIPTWDPGSGGGGSGTPGGGGSGGSSGTYPACVEASPAGASPTAVMDAAKALVAEIKAGNAGWEYAGFVYTFNGQVHRTSAHTDQSFDNVRWSTAWLPAGATIVAMVHSHPNDIMDDGYPSPEDWSAYNTLQGSSLPNGITMDSNALMFIFTDQDNKTRVYDKTDKSENSSSCAV